MAVVSARPWSICSRRRTPLLQNDASKYVAAVVATPPIGDDPSPQVSA
jgi:hypothetical protein